MFPPWGAELTKVDSILFLTHHFPPEIGGIQTRIANYMKTLRAMGVEVNVLYFTINEKPVDKIDRFGCRIITRSGSVGHFLQNFGTIARVTISQRVDVIHVFSGAATLVSLVAITLGRILGIPSVVSFFGREEFDLQKPTQRIGFPLALALSTAILVNTRYTSTLLPRRYQGKTRVILGGAEVARQTYSSQSGRTLLFVGRLVKSKGIDDLISAFKTVLLGVPDAKLVVVGDGPERQALEQMVDLSGIGRSVRFTGTLRGERLEAEYEKCAMVVLPSKSVPGEVVTETFGFSLVEGAMHGKPLIGTNHGGIPEIITNNYNGLLVPEANQTKLASAIKTLLLDEESAKRLGQNSLRIAMEKFTWEVATKRLLDAYRRRVS